jgi:hypothetical protein
MEKVPMKFKVSKIFPWVKDKKIPKNFKGTRGKKKYLGLFSTRSAVLSPLSMRQAVLLWIAKQKPTGIGIDVPTRFSKFMADAAAFWSSPSKKKIYLPKKIMIVEIRRDREECWPDCAKHQSLLGNLLLQKELKRKIEIEIRKEEPELKDNDTLFNEYENWQYKKSKNEKYHKCLKKIEDIEHSIYKGSFFERIRAAHVADNLYIAVPKGVIHADELADGWGLLYIEKDLTVSVEKEADNWDCENENRLHLIQNIAASSLKSSLYTQGINIDGNGKFFLTSPPHRRLKTDDRPEI